MSELFAATREPFEQQSLALLPTHDNLPTAERRAIEVIAASADSERLGLTVDWEALETVARESDANDATHLRAEVLTRHGEIQRRLWGSSEPEGKAYELGGALADTHNRVAEASGVEAKLGALAAVFGEERSIWLSRLLNELQARLSPRAVLIVRRQLEKWRAFTSEQLPRLEFSSDKKVAAYEIDRALRAQSIVWRQLLSQDHQPEGFLGAPEREQLRRRVVRRALGRYGRWAPLLLVLGVSGIAALFILKSEDAVWKSLVAGASAVLGALGITRAAVVEAVRSRVGELSQLLYEEVLVELVSEATLKTGDIRAASALSNRVRLRAREAGGKVLDLAPFAASTGKTAAP